MNSRPATLPRPDKKSFILQCLYQIYGLGLVTILYYLFIPVVEAMRGYTGALDFRNLVVVLAIPLLFYWLVNQVAPGSSIGGLFIKGILAIGIIRLLFPEKHVIRDMWFPTACFGLGFLAILFFDWQWKKQVTRSRAEKQRRRALRKKKDVAGVARGQVISKDDPEAFTKAQERLERKYRSREAKDQAKARPLAWRILFELYHLLVVLGVNAGCLVFLDWVAGLDPVKDDFLLVLWFLSPVLYYWALKWTTRRIRPVRVFIESTLFAVLLGTCTSVFRSIGIPNSIQTSGILAWPIFCFGIAAVVSLWTGRRERKRLARLKAEQLKNPMILDEVGADGHVPDPEESWDERENRDRILRRIRRKFSSKREHSGFYRHPWYFR